MIGRRLMTISSVVLTCALAASGVLVFRALGNQRELEEHVQRDALLAERDRLRTRVADLVARRRVTALPRTQESVAAFRAALAATAAGFVAAPLDGQGPAGTFSCVAMEFTSGADTPEIWTSSPLGPEDQARVVAAALESLRTATEGSTADVHASRIDGAAWAAYVVAGRVHVAALVWMSPRRS